MSLTQPQIVWQHRDTTDSEFWSFTVGKLVLTIQDCDGDCSFYTIKENDQVIEMSQMIYNDLAHGPYHADLAKNFGIEALIPVAKQRGLYKE